jgi:serine/threonine protein phosphatase 1
MGRLEAENQSRLWLISPNTKKILYELLFLSRTSKPMRKIAISDIHGCCKTLRALLEQRLQLTRKDQLYLLGDHVDRGPDSKGVLDYVMQLEEAGYQVNCLRGNHEEMMLNAGQDQKELEMWMYNGGQETLASFDVGDPGEIPEKYLDYVRNMDYFYEVDRYILVHAGLNFARDEEEEKKKGGFLWKMHNPLRDLHSMLWIRFWYDDIDWNWMKDRVIVHGHTPIDLEEIWDMYDVLQEDQVLDIDNGCFAKYKEGLGQLCAFEMTQRQLFFQENIE